MQNNIIEAIEKEIAYYKQLGEKTRCQRLFDIYFSTASGLRKAIEIIKTAQQGDSIEKPPKD